MGVESRQWHRDGPARRGGARLGRGWVLAAVCVAVLTAAAVSPVVSDRLGYGLPLGIGDAFRTTDRGGEQRLSPLPGGPSVAVSRVSLYPHDDPWRAWLADEATCPNAESTSASPRDQLQTMTCLMNVARRRQGLAPLTVSTILSSSAGAKASDIVRCGTFEHTACGKAGNDVALALGYRGSFGENLYIAEGPLGAPRVAMDGWLNSPGHREDLFRPEWRTAGIALLQHATLGRFHDAALWVMEFGDR